MLIYYEFMSIKTHKNVFFNYNTGIKIIDSLVHQCLFDIFDIRLKK